MSGDLYIFNPEHDLCLANGDMNFIPPFSALRFAQDCAGLTAWADGSAEDVARAEAAVHRLRSCAEAAAGADSAAGLPACYDVGAPVRRIIPWGWDAVLKRRLQRQGMPDALLPSDEQLSRIRRLSHRTVAAEAERFIASEIGDSGLCPARPVLAISDPADIAPAVDRIGEVVLKAPWSGSGKGLRYTRRGELSESDMGWCRHIIARQGCVMLERRERVIQDFAMLFSISERDEVKFEGYSLFWNEGGAYRGNVLAGDGWIRGRLSGMIPAEVLDRARAAVTEFLTRRFAGCYRGYVGVDMFVYEDDAEECPAAWTDGDAERVSASSSTGMRRSGRRRFRLAPCVELNVRMTMGLLARRLADRHLPRETFPDGKYVLTVEYSPDPARLAQRMSGAVKVLSAPSPDGCYGVGVYEKSPF